MYEIYQRPGEGHVEGLELLVYGTHKGLEKHQFSS